MELFIKNLTLFGLYAPLRADKAYGTFKLYIFKFNIDFIWKCSKRHLQQSSLAKTLYSNFVKNIPHADLDIVCQ